MSRGRDEEGLYVKYGKPQWMLLRRRGPLYGINDMNVNEIQIGNNSTLLPFPSMSPQTLHPRGYQILSAH